MEERLSVRPKDLLVLLGTIVTGSVLHNKMRTCSWHSVIVFAVLVVPVFPYPTFEEMLLMVFAENPKLRILIGKSKWSQTENTDHFGSPHLCTPA